MKDYINQKIRQFEKAFKKQPNTIVISTIDNKLISEIKEISHYKILYFDNNIVSLPKLLYI